MYTSASPNFRNTSGTALSHENSTAESTIQFFSLESSALLLTTSDIWFIITISLRYLELAVTFAGNWLVLIAISRFTYLQTPVFWFICGLSLSDLISISLAPILHIQLHYVNTVVARYICHAQIMLTFPFALGNLLFSLLIALERLITLSYPLTYMTIITNSRVTKVFICSWIYLFSLTAILLFSGHHSIMTMKSLSCQAAFVLPTLSHSILAVHVYSINLGKTKVSHYIINFISCTLYQFKDITMVSKFTSM